MNWLKSRNPSEEEMNVIKNKSFGEERALYNSKDLYLSNVKFEGKEDGESALKESSSIVVEKCKFDLRYPLWHVNNADIIDSEFTINCRAAFWYDNQISLKNCLIRGPKIFRECKNVELYDTDLESDEPFWNCKNLLIENSKITGVYAYFGCKNLSLNNVTFNGKYSFQYIEGLHLKNCVLNTKDAFWHSKDVVCEDCTIKGEYLGWYSKNITFINCTIESHQPLCYVKGVKFINCKMPNCDLALEYSQVKGNIVGKIDSIKNPKSGKLVVEEMGELINESSKYKSKAKIVVNKSTQK